jgi:two-component system, OmpR family, copper resistance phosphate regulon response regulator CusR
MKLLIVEDDPNVSGLLRRGLEEEGYEVLVASDGEVGLRAALKTDLDCVILDVMLPGRDGFSVCASLRESGKNTPILMLTVRDAVEDRVKGLSAGADDYLIKPFSFEELLARVQALIRRRSQYSEQIVRFEDLELDLLSRKARRAGQTLDLTPKEFALVEYLMKNQGRVISEEELIERVWGLDFDPQTNVVNVFVHHLRKKIDSGDLPRLIRTVRGRGFILAGE